MARVSESKKACAVNPLKMSQPLGACYAFLGMDRCMPMMHGSQGCTSLGLVLLVRHFKEAIPLQTTAMNEVSTILGGMDNIEQAILNIKKRANPALIGIASTGLTETKGDDVEGFLRLIHARHAATLLGTRVVYVSTPDYVGAFQDGWEKAVTAMIDAFALPATERRIGQVNLLPGSQLSPADVEELREVIEAFGLDPVVMPDVSGSLDGHVPDTFSPTTIGGTPLERMMGCGASVATLAIGRQMASAAQALEDRAGVPFRVFDRVCGLTAFDDFLMHLSTLSGRPVPPKYRRQRSQLQDAMLDAHFHLGGRRFAIGAEPDLLCALVSLATEMGAEVPVAVTTTQSPVLAGLPCGEVLIGDLEDLENGARAKACELILTHAHGRQAAARLGIPLVRTGLPVFDRLGASHRLMVGYRGTAATLFEWANAILENEAPQGSGDWPLPPESLAAARGETRSCGSACSAACTVPVTS